jgi:hypothetical protein
MSRSKYTRDDQGRTRRKPGFGGPKFVQLFWFVVDSPVWHEMSGDECKAYVYVQRRFNGMNNGQLAVSSRQLSDDMGCSISKAARLLKKLVWRGVLEITRRSAFHIKNKKAAEYRLVTHQCDKTQKLPSWTPQTPLPKSSPFPRLKLQPNLAGTRSTGPAPGEALAPAGASLSSLGGEGDV